MITHARMEKMLYSLRTVMESARADGVRGESQVSMTTSAAGDALLGQLVLAAAESARAARAAAETEANEKLAAHIAALKTPAAQP